MHKSFSHFFQNNIVKTITVVGAVLVLSWSITQATTSSFEEATKNFSVIGTVSSITEDTISIIDARGSDTQTEDLYNLDITHIKTVETRDYAPLVISDVTVGSTIVAQGVTNDSTFFITRIVLFSDLPFEPQEETPIPTEDAVLEEEPVSDTPVSETQTESTSEQTPTNSEDTNVPEEVISDTPEPTTINEVLTETPQEEVLPTLEPSISNTETTPPTVIDTVVDILEDGINDVSDIFDSFMDAQDGVIQTESSSVE